MMTVETTTEAREQAIDKLKEYRWEYAEADNISLSMDAGMWERWQKKVSAAATDAGLTEEEIEGALYGDG